MIVFHIVYYSDIHIDILSDRQTLMAAIITVSMSLHCLTYLILHIQSKYTYLAIILKLKGNESARGLVTAL